MIWLAALLSVVCSVLFLRSQGWYREWEDLGAIHARTLDELARIRQELKQLQAAEIMKPFNLPHRSPPPGLSIVDRVVWDIQQYLKSGTWNERMVWRIHPEDADMLWKQMRWRQKATQQFVPHDGIRVMGTRVIADPSIARYDSIGEPVGSSMLDVSKEQAARMVSEGGTGLSWEDAQRLGVPGVQAADGLGAPGEAQEGGGGESGPWTHPAPDPAPGGPVSVVHAAFDDDIPF